MTAPKLTTRKLTGIAPWPIVLIAAGEKRGKTWSAVEACMSDLVTGGLWFPLGENDPDEYALIPDFDGDRFDLVEHDGTYRGLMDQLTAALAAEKAARPGKPSVWVLDSGTRLWDLLSGMAQQSMWQRLARKAAQRNQPAPDTEQKPSVDLWNTAADRWGHVMDALREHNGPVIITARMELKAVMNANGEPTRDKEEKILAHKTLPFDVDAIVELQAPGDAVITGVRSVKLASTSDDRKPMKPFTVDKLWRALGVDVANGPRSHTPVDAEDKPGQEADRLRAELRQLIADRGWNEAELLAEFVDFYDVQPQVASAKVLAEYLALKRALPHDDTLLDAERERIEAGGK